MEQHRDAPSHASMFSCEVCQRPFGSRQAVEQHNKTSLHARMLARAKPPVGHVVGVSLDPENVSSLSSSIMVGGIVSYTDICPRFHVTKRRPQHERRPPL